MIETNNRLISTFNDAQFQIERLNYSWVKCNNYSTKGLLINWRWELDVIFRELSYDMFKLGGSNKVLDLNNNKLFKLFNELDKDIKKNIANKSKLYELLKEKEIKLRIIQNQVNKGGKYQDDDERSIE